MQQTSQSKIGWFGRLFNPASPSEKLQQFIQSNMTFDANWRVFNNVALPSGNTVDAILLGRNGVFVIEIGGDSNNHRLQDGVWRTEIGFGRKWKTVEWNPVDRAQRKADQLQLYLEQQGIAAAVYGRLFWVGGGLLGVSAENNSIWQPKKQAAASADVAQQPRLTTEQLAQAGAYLSKMARSPIASHLAETRP